MSIQIVSYSSSETNGTKTFQLYGNDNKVIDDLTHSWIGDDEFREKQQFLAKTRSKI